MKNLIAICFITVAFNFILTDARGQEKKDSLKIYNVQADPKDQLNEALKTAQAQHKNIFIQIGGDWCVWCKRFYAYTKNNHEIDSIIKANYVVLHINYSKENKNLPFMRALEFPQRFGFPVFVMMDQNGNRLNTQNSSYLESKETYYDKEKVIDFLKAWSPAAFDPMQYEK